MVFTFCAGLVLPVDVEAFIYATLCKGLRHTLPSLQRESPPPRLSCCLCRKSGAEPCPAALQKLAD